MFNGQNNPFMLQQQPYNQIPNMQNMMPTGQCAICKRELNDEEKRLYKFHCSKCLENNYIAQAKLVGGFYQQLYKEIYGEEKTLDNHKIISFLVKAWIDKNKI